MPAEPRLRRLRVLAPVRPASVTAAARARTFEMLAELLPPAQIGRDVLAWHAEALALRRSEEPLSEPLACASGCAHCCRFKVTGTPVEILRLAAFIEETFDPPAIASLRERLDAVYANAHGVDATTRVAMGLACPLLGEDARCLAYEARPLSCRGANSFDAEGCRISVGAGRAVTVRHDPVQLGLASSIAAGVTYATRDRRALDYRVVELVAALRIALDRPDAAGRWKKGEKVFEDAVDPEFAAASR